MINPEKYDLLQQWLSGFKSVMVAFSGGVDSTLVLFTARKVLGKNALACTVKTPYIPEWEVREAKAFCQENDIRHILLEAEILPDLLNNPENRCYLCKQYLFTLLKEKARQEGCDAVLDGSNADDQGVYRPGLMALRELGIKSPLLENGITKAEVRHFSRELGIPTADKPAYACLLTRLPYRYAVKKAELERIEKAERYLDSIGFGGSRVRNHGTTARIELVKERMTEFVNAGHAQRVALHFHQLGYAYVTLDLDGYRSGSFDTNLTQSYQ